MAVLILARNYTEARAYAVNDLELAPGAYRIITGIDSLRAARNSDLHLVPGWKRRHDKFAIQSHLRWTRLNVIDVEAARDQLADDPDFTLGVVDMVPAPEEGHNWDDGGDLDAEADHEARKAAYLRDLEERGVIEPEGWEPPESLDAEQVLRLAAGESGADVAPEPEAETEAKRTRRRRCKDCGVLVEPDEVESHAASHESE